MKHVDPERFEEGSVPLPPYEEPYIEPHCTAMEFMWVAIPTLIVLYFFIWRGAIALLGLIFGSL